MTVYANVGHILLKRGNTVQSTAYTGPLGELTYDTDLRTLRVHDGSTVGGNVILINQTTLTAYQTYANANAATQANSINTINANIGSFYTYANANAATQATSIASVNANVTASDSAIGSLRANITAANSAIQALSANIGTLVAGAPGALDTLLELGNALGNSSSFSSTMVVWLGNITSNVTAANSRITTLDANLGTATTNITTLFSNAATQATGIDAITANIGGSQTYANTQVNTISANLGAYQTYANLTFSTVANAASQGADITTLLANATTQATSIDTITANLGAYQTYGNLTFSTVANAASQASDITTLYSNAATQATSIDTINANITAANTAIQSLSANIGALVANAPGALDTLAEIDAALGNNASFSSVMVTWLGNITTNVTTANTSIDTINANLGAYQIYANANIGTLYNGNTSTQANLGAYQTYANANAASQSTSIATLQTQVYANANVAAYLPTYTGDIAANIVKNGYTWTFGTDGITTLPAGGVITEGGGLTGAIRLTPAGGANANQALLIYPTAAADGDHVHLTAGGGSTELYLGNDYHYVKLVDGGNIELRATTANLSPQASWTFDTAGNIDARQALAIKVPNGVPSNVAVINSTTGSWEANPNLSLATTGGTGTGLTVNVADTGGYASTIEIATAGTGYTNGDLITVTSGTSNATFTIVIASRNSWQFGGTGNLTLPETGYLRVGSGIVAGFISSPAPIISGFSSISAVNLGASGNVLAGGQVIANGVIESGAGFSTGGYLSVDGSADLHNTTVTGNISATGNINASQYNFANGVNILSTVAGTYGNANVAEYLPTYTGNIAGNIVKSGYTWTFSNTGTTTFPTGVRLSNARGANTVNFTTDVDKSFQIETQTSTTGRLWSFGTDGNLTLPQNANINFSNGVSILSTVDAYQTYANANAATQATSIATLQTQVYANANVATYLSNYDGGINFTASPAVITGLGNISSANFTFANGVNILSTVGAGSYGNAQVASYLLNFDGDIEFTSSTAKIGNVDVITVGDHIRSPAYQFSNGASILSNVVTKVSDSWTVTTGTNTYSFTVSTSGTYQLWVDCNIPNGILAWNATATITNSNVPVVGAQYAWVYDGGGTPIDFTSIPNQFVGTANTIVRSNTAPSATTNRFDFGINNTSGGNVTVRYGWIAIS
jgi:hypothetical protein